MRPQAHLAAAAECLDRWRSGRPIQAVLKDWARANRYAGSGDRAAISDLVFQALRRRGSWAHLGGGDSGRQLMLGMLLEAGEDLSAWADGSRYALEPVTEAERAAFGCAFGAAGVAEGGAEQGWQIGAEIGAARGDLALLDWPDWLRSRLAADLGDDLQAVSAAMRCRAPVFLRCNLPRIDRADLIARLRAEGTGADAVPDSEAAIVVHGNPRGLERTAALQEGLAELQDLNSQRVVERLPLQPGQRVLDYCAGGGGKTLALAARLAAGDGARSGRGQPPVAAWDAEPRRMRDLPDRAARAGARIRLLDRPAGLWDLVLCDAPCSGSGSWRRDPQGKWHLTQARLTELARLQPEIICRAARFVAPGGVLAYATCSLLEAENGASVATALARLDGWKLEGESRWRPRSRTDGDGFYLAVLRHSR